VVSTAITVIAGYESINTGASLARTEAQAALSALRRVVVDKWHEFSATSVACNCSGLWPDAFTGGYEIRRGDNCRAVSSATTKYGQSAEVFADLN
jgi:hypothetical protein